MHSRLVTPHQIDEALMAGIIIIQGRPYVSEPRAFREERRKGICLYMVSCLSILLSSARHTLTLSYWPGIVEYSISRYIGLGATHSAWDSVWGAFNITLEFIHTAGMGRARGVSTCIQHRASSAEHMLAQTPSYSKICIVYTISLWRA